MVVLWLSSENEAITNYSVVLLNWDGLKDGCVRLLETRLMGWGVVLWPLNKHAQMA